MKALTTLFVVGMFTTAVTADDVDDIEAAEQEHFTTQSVDVIMQHHLAGHTAFAADGGLLERFDSLEEERKDREANLDARRRANLQLRHLEVKIYGNLTAVTTGYVVGTVTAPDGTIQQVNRRRTAVLIKQGARWKEVHSHNSPLVLPQASIADSAEDERALRELWAKFEESFNRHDAEEVASLYLVDGDRISHQGEVGQGRAKEEGQWWIAAGRDRGRIQP